jgi:hypothetical protein
MLSNVSTQVFPYSGLGCRYRIFGICSCEFSFDNSGTDSAPPNFRTQNGVSITSTLLRDKLALDKESGRDQIRRIAKRLKEEGKVTISEKTVGKRKQYVYKLKI